MLIKKINVSQEQCISTGNFESKRIQYGIEAELSETDNYNAVYNHLRGIIEEELEKEYNNVKETVSETKSIVPELSLPLKQFDPTDTRLEIKCPKCDSPMTLKKGRTGEFWGCSAYKSNNCNGIVNLNQVETYLKTGTLTKKWGY